MILPEKILNEVLVDLGMLNDHDSSLFVANRINVIDLKNGVIHGDVDSICRVASLYSRGVLLKRKTGFAVEILEYVCSHDGRRSVFPRYALGHAYNLCKKYEMAYATFHELITRERFGMAFTAMSHYYALGITVEKSELKQFEYLKLGAQTGDAQSKNIYSKHLLRSGNVFRKIQGLISILFNTPALLKLLSNRAYDGREFGCPTLFRSLYA